MAELPSSYAVTASDGSHVSTTTCRSASAMAASERQVNSSTQCALHLCFVDRQVCVLWAFTFMFCGKASLCFVGRHVYALACQLGPFTMA